jgi:hypothetical protein
MGFFKEQLKFFLDTLVFFLRAIKYSAVIAVILGSIAALTYHFLPYSLAVWSGMATCYLVMHYQRFIKARVMAFIEKVKHDLCLEAHKHV